MNKYTEVGPSTNQNWENAACAHADPALFDDPHSLTNPAMTDAKRVRTAYLICHACPVWRVCLDTARVEKLTSTMRGGLLFGGTTPVPLHWLEDRPAPVRERALKPCGTRAAYQRHLSSGEVACESCQEAAAADQRARAQRRKEAAA